MKKRLSLESLNRELSLISWMGILFGTATVLVVSVMAYDRCQEIAFIDHLVDMHVNEDAIREACEVRNQQVKNNERIKGDWVREINSYDRDSDRGTNAAPDRDSGKR